MKKIFLLLLTSFVFICSNAQDQTINGNLTLGTDIAGKFDLGYKLYFRGCDSSDDPIWMAKYTNKKESTDLRVNIGDGADPSDRFIVGTTVWDTQKWDDNFVVTADGKVGIGISRPKNTLDVNGKLHAREVLIDNTGWADFVFDKSYKLPTLEEVEAHINKHSRLPEIPSEAEVKENGINVGEMQVILLQKIEELTLYVIQQQKELNEVKKENKELRTLVNNK